MIKAHKSKPNSKKEIFSSVDTGMGLGNKNDQSKIDKLDISLLSRNISNLFEQIKTVTNDIQFKNILIEK